MSTAVQDVASVTSSSMFEAPVERLRPSPSNRPVSEESVAELVPSISEVGVLMPLLVRPLDDGWEIVAGERRWRAACKAGLATVPVVERRDLGEDRQREMEAATVENLCRTALHPIDEGRRFAELTAPGGRSQSALAKFLGHGWSQPLISNRILVVTALDRLPDGLAADVETAYRRGDLQVRQAESLARIIGYADDGLFEDIEEHVVDVVRQVVDMAAAESRRPEVDGALLRMTRNVKHLADERKVRAALADAGVRDVTDDPPGSWVAVERLAREVGDSLSTHATLPCHAAVVSTIDGEPAAVDVCTAPDTHRVIDDQDDADAAGTPLAPGAPPASSSPIAPSPTMSAEAAERMERRARFERGREREATARSEWPARCEIVKGALGRTRSAAKVLDRLLEQLVFDRDLTSVFGDDIVEVLGIDFDDDEPTTDDILTALVAFYDEGVDNQLRLALAFAAVMADERLRILAGREDLDQLAGDRAVRSYLDFLTDNGHELTVDERLLLGPDEDAEPHVEVEVEVEDDDEAVEPPAVTEDVDPAEVVAEVEVEPHGFVGAEGAPCSECGAVSLADHHYDEAGFPLAAGAEPRALVAAVEWPAFTAARQALVAMPKSTPKAEAFEQAKGDLAAALVAHHPDVEDLAAELTVLGDEYAGVEATPEIVADLARRALALLEQAGTLPADLVLSAMSGVDLELGTRPDDRTPGAIRRLYLDDVVDAAKARQ